MARVAWSHPRKHIGEIRRDQGVYHAHCSYSRRRRQHTLLCFVFGDVQRHAHISIPPIVKWTTERCLSPHIREQKKRKKKREELKAAARHSPGFTGRRFGDATTSVPKARKKKSLRRGENHSPDHAFNRMNVNRSSHLSLPLFSLPFSLRCQRPPRKKKKEKEKKREKNP